MYKRAFAPVLALVFALSAPSAQAFFDPPWITPEQPLAGEMVYINIHGGICDAITTTPGYPQVILEGNAIRFVVSGVHEEDLDWCIYGVGTATYPIGVYPAGAYVLTAEMRYTDFYANPAVLTIGAVDFSVRGTVAPTVPVPAAGSTMLVVLLVLVAGIALLALHRRRAHALFVLFALVSLDVRAQYIINCVSGATGAPSSAAIVNWVNTKPHVGTPPLQAYSSVAPLDANYLIPDRATGDFLGWLMANPQSARAKLERCVIERYNVPDVAAALAALQGDP
ncbi:MAG: hypothetical protein ACTHK2_00990 [Dokdonella sp.]|uniref:hypothetical protein n=1 Tax=Dokdonella sp. TaxID=2291710 RepID=UPI003F815E8F